MYSRYCLYRPEPVNPPDTLRSGALSSTMPASSPGNPADLATGPLAGTGLKMLETDPDDVFIPDGAVRHYAARRKTPDGAADIVVYNVEANIADVESFYRAKLAQAGYKLVQQKPGMQPGSVSLVFLRDGQGQYCVNLRPADKEQKRTKISLVIARPDWVNK